MGFVDYGFLIRFSQRTGEAFILTRNSSARSADASLFPSRANGPLRKIIESFGQRSVDGPAFYCSAQLTKYDEKNHGKGHDDCKTNPVGLSGIDSLEVRNLN